MKIKYSVNNLRSIQNMEPAELRPITMLIGKNNSGKSTFLRSFSLFRQSLEEDTDEPIFWNGKFVDFGNFPTAVNGRDRDREISFKFELEDICLNDIYANVKPRRLDCDKNPSNHCLKNVSFEIFVKSSKNRSVLHKIVLHISDFDLSFEITFNEIELQTEVRIKNVPVCNNMNENVGLNYNISNITDKYGKLNTMNPFKLHKNVFDIEYISMKFHSEICEILSGYTESNFKKDEQKDAQYFDSAYMLDAATYLLTLKLPLKQGIEEFLNETNDEQLKNYLAPLLKSKNIDDVDEICTRHMVNRVVSYVIAVLQDFFGSTLSIGPSRVRSDRYNREQGYSSSEIAIDGRNLPKFLLSLEENKMLEEFSNWVEGIIGYKITIDQDSEKLVENICVNIIDEGLSVNVIDAGYGISQLLPVLAQIWLTGVQNKIPRNGRGVMSMASNFRPVTIEQPELHLHPAHQAQIADALVKTLEENGNGSQGKENLYLIETHSSALVSRIGRKIRDGGLSCEDVQILVFNKRQSVPNSTEVTAVTFDEKGTLSENWPYGFFNY